MLQLLPAYLMTLCLFAVIDIAWIMTVAIKFYRSMLGDALLASPRLIPAVLFYGVFSAGIVYFGVAPGIAARSPVLALVNGGLIGLIAYATYDLTNYATLKDWTLGVTILDIAYGTVVAGVVAAITCVTLMPKAG